MNVDDWITEAVRSRTHGSSLREVQRYIDEHHREELSVKVLGDALDRLVQVGKLEVDNERYFAVSKTNKEDALKRLFGE
jgi:aldehyde:ferredoxin oxidoreductase